MKKLLPIILMLFSITTFAQNTATTIWTAAFGLQDTVLRIPTAVDNARYAYVAGSTIDSATGANILLQKYDPWGNPLWTASYTGTGYHRDQATTIDIDANYNIIVGGFTYTNSTNNYDYLVLKYDSAGTLLWTYTYNGTGSAADLVSALTINSNNIYLTGASIGSSTLFDYTTIKLNSSGVVQWNNRYNYLGADIPFDIDISGANVFVNGGSQSSITDWDYAQVTYSTSGTATDTIRTTGTGVGFDHATQAVTDAQGYVYITGTYASLSNGLDYKTIKLDQQGNIKWISTFNGTGNNDDVANSVGVDYYGNVYVTGYSQNSTGNDDYCTIKYDSTGTQQWIRYYNNNGHSDRANKLIVGDDNNIYITGESSNGSNKDFATIGYNEIGDTLWTVRFNGIYNSDDMATNIEKHDGYIYVSGQSKVSPTTYQYVTIAYGEATYETIPDPFNEEPGNTWFYPNEGQLANSDGIVKKIVNYYSQNQSPAIYLIHCNASYVFSHQDNDTATADTTQRVDMQFMDYSGNTIKQDVYEVDKGSAHYLNFYLPQCPNGIVDVKGFKTLFTETLYKGIDLYYTSNAAGLKHYFVLKEGAKVADISMNFDGADSISHSAGTYTIHTSVGALKFDTLIAYEVDASGAIIPNTTQPLSIYADTIHGYWHFVPISHNPSNTLVIMAKKEVRSATPPTNNFNAIWCSYWGAYYDDDFTDVTTDMHHSSVFAGNTTNIAFPTLSGITIGQSINAGQTDGVLFKLNKDFVAQWITLIGGSLEDKINAVTASALSSGAFYCAGKTYSYDLPLLTSFGAYRDSIEDGDDKSDMLIASFSNNGYLLWSTTFGETDADDFASDIAIKHTPDGDRIFIGGRVGEHADTVFVPGASNYGSYIPFIFRNSFLLAFGATGILHWASYTPLLRSLDHVTGVAVTDNYKLLVSGVFYDNGGILPPPGFNPHYASYIMQYDIFSLSYEWGDIIGSDGNHSLTAVAGDHLGNVYAVGNTTGYFTPKQFDTGSTDDYFQDTVHYQEAFITRYDSLGNNQWYSGIGTEGNDAVYALAIDQDNNVYIAGTTDYDNFPTPATQPTNFYVQETINEPSTPALSDAFIARFNPHCDLEWRTYWGTKYDYVDEKINSLHFDGSRMYLCGNVGGGGHDSVIIPIQRHDWNNQNEFYVRNFQHHDNDQLEAFGACFDTLLVTGINHISKNLNSSNLFVYPNPANSILNINYNSNISQSAMVNIISYEGKQVISKSLNLKQGNNLLQLNIDQLANGLYVIQIINNSTNETVKIIKR